VSQPAAGTTGGDDCGSSLSSYCTWPNLSATITGRIETTGDKDWYKITPPVSGTWTFTSSKPASGALNDPVGTLYGADGRAILAYNDDGAGNLQFRLGTYLIAGQTYYLEVAGVGSGTGSYVVSALLS